METVWALEEHEVHLGVMTNKCLIAVFSSEANARKGALHMQKRAKELDPFVVINYTIRPCEIDTISGLDI